MRRFIFYFWLGILLAGCGGAVATPTPFPPTATQSAATVDSPTVNFPTGNPPTATAVSPTVPPTRTTNTTIDPGLKATPSTYAWPTPLAVLEPLLPQEVTIVQWAVRNELLIASPPQRDDVALAIAFSGVSTTPEATAVPVSDLIAIGTHQTFNITNSDTNTISEIDAVLLAVSDHAYFWFDTGPGTVEPTQRQLDSAAKAFDSIYETDHRYFGEESIPGIDGDPRVYILHVSPIWLCDVTLATADSCGLAGYFSSNNALPTAVDPSSNEHEMFFMNSDTFGTRFYLNVLGHEFRHMIEDHYDHSDADWEVEGSAVLAEELLGFRDSPIGRGGLFLQDPDQQLNSWTDNNTLPYYGQGYLFNRYLFDRMGEKIYRQFATSPAAGFLAINEVAQANDLLFNSLSLWLDWLVALAIHNKDNAPTQYTFPTLPDLDTVDMVNVRSLPYSELTTVSQYAADYYSLPAQDATITFTGAELVPLLTAVPPSGEGMWYAQRANYSNPRLTREVDLTSVTAATLSYAVYVDLEHGYDFAYVSASTDNGQTWQALTAPNMQTKTPDDDPSDSALTEHFYTGRVRNWLKETVDLTPYAGQKILIRFEMVTDPILTFNGFALDNIAIPEINFYDAAEPDTPDLGWTAEGFSRVTAYLPQNWHIQLITFPGGVPTVEKGELSQGQTLTIPFTVGDQLQKPILIVAATAPLTLQPATYSLEIK